MKDELFLIPGFIMRLLGPGWNCEGRITGEGNIMYCVFKEGDDPILHGVVLEVINETSIIGIVEDLLTIISNNPDYFRPFRPFYKPKNK